MPLGKVFYKKLATAFSLCLCIETRGVLLVFASCVGSAARGNDVSAENRGTARGIGSLRSTTRQPHDAVSICMIRKRFFGI